MKQVDQLTEEVKQVRTWLDERQQAANVTGLYGA